MALAASYRALAAYATDLAAGRCGPPSPTAFPAGSKLEDPNPLLTVAQRPVLFNLLEEAGALAGLTHPKLSKAISPVHQDPQQAWTLECLARKAGMSRSRFAFHFHRSSE